MIRGAFRIPSARIVEGMGTEREDIAARDIFRSASGTGMFFDGDTGPDDTAFRSEYRRDSIIFK